MCDFSCDPENSLSQSVVFCVEYVLAGTLLYDIHTLLVSSASDQGVWVQTLAEDIVL